MTLTRYRFYGVVCLASYCLAGSTNDRYRPSIVPYSDSVKSATLTPIQSNSADVEHLGVRRNAYSLLQPPINQVSSSCFDRRSCFRCLAMFGQISISQL